MKKFIRFYAADGTIPADKQEKKLFRIWAKKELSLAFSDYRVEVSKEHSVPIYSSNEEDLELRRRILQFCNNLHSRWVKQNTT